ncbi:MAG TPA: type I restriction endonuclease subunit R [Anaerolineales bacterium]|nr:type I restriction endonuclease subunit R [Anaerolineales bacterium]
MPNFISEDNIEQAIVQKLVKDYGYRANNCYTENPDDLNDNSGRTDKREVIFHDRLKAAALRLNPDLPEAAVDLALSKLTDPRGAMTTIAANREIDTLIRDGIPVQYEGKDGHTEHGRVRVVDFGSSQAKDKNDYLVVTQLWVRGLTRYRRPDVLIYVNGLPLVFIELKNSKVSVQAAYDDNLTNYKQDIPRLFHFNAFCILSNALDTRVGSFNSDWEHFFVWLRPDDETEKIDREVIEEQGISIERALAGLFPHERLRDYIENFILFYNETEKIIAQNHQFIGVNKGFKVFADRQNQKEDGKGKLGVYWHTQGSGKSFSMIFYARKIWRKMTGNFTFLVVTDRDDLDGQIYRNFLNTETVKKNEAARPKDSEELRNFLTQNKRIVFTLIQKFRYEKGKKYPILSKRDDIIVIVDEAHRTQYKSLAENMRAGLPHAQYLAFTATPLLGKDRKTNQWFGDYVSEYNFTQSTDDGATVPLFYEKRVPEVLIQNDDLGEEFYQIVEDENLDEAQIAKLENKFAQDVQVIKRDDRLEKIARDIVYHFPRRGYLGKGLVISVDKFTAVKMYDKVQYHWKEAIKDLRKQISQTFDRDENVRLTQMLEFMRSTEMAVVISEEADEEKKFADQKLDIKPHRQRMNQVDENGHDIEYQFKDKNNPLRLVFVCAMWLTGFDIPSLSTLYLDKPMKDHTLMQAITRANRVTNHRINGVPKNNGEIIDYYNVFRNMKRALADYAVGSEGLEVLPIQDKAKLFDLLDDAIAQGLAFCKDKGIHLKSVLDTKEVFKNLAKFNTFADILLSKDEWRKEFTVYENTISALYEACKPEIFDSPRRMVDIFRYLREVLDAIIERQDVSKVELKIAQLLDESVVTSEDNPQTAENSEQFKIVQIGKTWDLSKVNTDKLKEEFAKSEFKHIEIADLRAFIETKLQQLLERNITRIGFAERYQRIIEQYNSGGAATEISYEDLINFTRDLNEEEERHIREGLTEQELELFDLMKKEKITKAEEVALKNAAKMLLKRLREEKPTVLVQNWEKDQQSQVRVKTAIEEVLDKNIPETYDRLTFKQVCDRIYNLIFERAVSGLAFG